MQSLGEYQSDSDASDAKDEDRKVEVASTRGVKRPAGVALPSVQELLGPEQSEEHEDDPTAHGGRVRTFKHVDGNWPSTVYIRVPPHEDVLKWYLKAADADGEWTADVGPLGLHVSMCRPFALRRHQIDPFIAALKREVELATRPFVACLHGLELFVNDDRTRSFLAVMLDAGQTQAIALVKAVDTALAKFNKPPFYADPKLHASFAWQVGDHSGEQRALQAVQVPPEQYLTWRVSHVHAQIGNRHFRLPLYGASAESDSDDESS